MSCCDNTNNPCNDELTNTAECESLPSQIENFTAQFFGTVTKTEVDGKVAWVLPCDLDVGLENNPRLAEEGLACYFLRLFEDGIVGATGPQGDTGAAGANGDNAYAITLTGFTQPTLDTPTIQVITNNYNQALSEGMYVFITGSGYYIVTATDATGSMWLTLTEPVSGAAGYLGVGKFVVPAGYPGQSIVGAQGPQGEQGVPGSAGETLTATNAFYSAAIGVDFALANVTTNVDFTNSVPQVTLAQADTYLINAVVALDAQVGVVSSDVVEVQLTNVNNGFTLSGSVQKKSYLSNGQQDQIAISVLYTSDTPNVDIRLQGKCTTAGAVNVVALRTTINAVRIG